MIVDRTLDTLRVYDVHTEARQKLFDAVGRLSQEQYVQEFPFAHCTVRATMIEIASTEWWLGARLREEPMPRPFRWEELPINETSYPTFASLKERWAELVPLTRDTWRGLPIGTRSLRHASTASAYSRRCDQVAGAVVRPIKPT